MLAVVDLMGSLTTLIYFFIGALLGLGLIMLIIYFLGKANEKNLSSIKKKEVFIPSTDPNQIILDSVNKYKVEYSKEPIKNRLLGVKDITLDMLHNISSAYIGNKKNSELDFDIETGFNLIKDIIKQFDRLIDDILDSSAFKTAWRSYALIRKTQNIMKKIFSKDKSSIDSDISYDIRSMKASYVFKRIKKTTTDTPEQIEESTSNQHEVEEIKETKKKSFFLLDSLINSKVIDFINDCGKEAIKVYSNTYYNDHSDKRGER